MSTSHNQAEIAARIAARNRRAAGEKVRVSIDQLVKINGCPHRGAPVKAGCQSCLRTCGLGKGQAGRVSMADCVACVETEGYKINST